jgi:hypothetical protein
MKSTLVLPLLLAGCASDVSEYQLVLDQYARSASEGNLSETLTGSALHEAEQSQQLLSDLGWRQQGYSSFTAIEISAPNQVLSCLDVSGIQFFDSEGEAVVIDRPSHKLLLRIDFSRNNPRLISRLEEVGKC